MFGCGLIRFRFHRTNPILKYYRYYVNRQDVSRIIRLIKKGHDPNVNEGILLYIINNNDFSLRGDTEVLERLLRAGCQVSNDCLRTIIENNRYKALDYMWEHGINLGFKPNDLIHRICSQVCYFDHQTGEPHDVCRPVLEMVKVFVKHGADLTKKDRSRVPATPLERAKAANHERLPAKIRNEFGEMVYPVGYNPLIRYLEENTRFQENAMRPPFKDIAPS